MPAQPTAILAGVVALLVAALIVEVGRRRFCAISLTTWVIIGVTTVVGPTAALVSGHLRKDLIAVAMCALAIAMVGNTKIVNSLGLLYGVITLAGLVLVIVGVRFPVFGDPLPDSLLTLALFAPLVLLCTNVEGSPGGQVAVTPIMLIGAGFVGLTRGDHHLVFWGLAAAGACYGVSRLTWLGRGIRLSIPASLFLAMTTISLGSAFQGKVGLSVLAIGVGMLVIPVTELFVLVEGRRRAGKLYWGPGEDHLWYRLRAHGLSGKVAAMVIMGAAVFGVTCSALTSAGIIIWPVGLVLAWTMKLTLTWWALRAPLPAGLPQRDS